MLAQGVTRGRGISGLSCSISCPFLDFPYFCIILRELRSWFLAYKTDELLDFAIRCIFCTNSPLYLCGQCHAEWHFPPSCRTACADNKLQAVCRLGRTWQCSRESEDCPRSEELAIGWA